MVFAFATIYLDATDLERTIGSVIFLFDFFLKNILIQIINFILSIFFSLFYSEIALEPSYGLWNTVMIYVTLRSLTNPDLKINFMCLPIQITAKYYPIALFVLLSMVLSIKLDLIAAILLALIEFKFFNGLLLRIN